MGVLDRADAQGARLVEAVTAGLAAAALLCWAGACLVASFRPHALAAPYWSGIPWLRTDTSGVLAFFAAAVCLTVSEYLRLRRRHGTGARQDVPPVPDEHGRGTGAVILFTQAAARAAALLSAGLVVYLSVNAVTHPYTLGMQVTHFVSWPTEGTVRVVALIMCAVAVGVERFLRTSAGWRSGLETGRGGAQRRKPFAGEQLSGP